MKQFSWCLCFAIFLAPSWISGQLVVDNTVNAVDGVTDVLLGPGITVSNIVFNGVPEQVAEFTCTDCNLGIANGLIMGSGNVDIAPGPNTVGSSSGSPSSGWGASDPDLVTLSGQSSLHGRASIEFDFIPTGDSVAFNYVFGSEEYSEYLGYGDVFGFFISGPGISGPFSNGAVNIALIPGTSTYVSVPNLNNGPSNTGPCMNCAYFNWNGPGGTYGSDDYYIEYDGFSDVFTASAVVQCGETYHIKLAIADMFDDGWDCAVFLEAGSFQSNQVEIAWEPPTISPGPEMLYEGCDIANLTFTRANSSQQVVYDIMVSGSATNGTDYTMIPATLTFPIGVNSVNLPVNALGDGLAEGLETVTLEISGTGVCTSTDATTFTFQIADVEPLSVLIADEVIDCNENIDLTPQISGGFGYYSVLWSTGDDALSLNVSPDVATTYSFIVTDTCGVNPWNGAVNVSFPNYPVITVDVGPDQQVSCLDDILIDPAVAGGYGVYTYSWTVNGSAVSTDPQLAYQTDDAGSVLLTITDECAATGNDQMNFTFPPVPVNVSLPTDMDVTCLDLTTIQPAVNGGIGAYAYQWLVNGIPAGYANTLDVQADGQTTVEVVVTDECENVGNDAMVLMVPPVPVSLELGANLSVTCLDISSLIPVVNGGVGNYSYSWSTQNGVIGVSPQLNWQTDNDVVINLEVTDECGNTVSDFLSIAVPQVMVSADLGPDISSTCIENNVLDPDPNGGVGNFSYSWIVNGQVAGVNPTFNLIADADTEVQVIVEDECGNQTVDELEVSIPPVPVMVNIGPDLVVTCLDNSLILSEVGGGVGSYTYSWNDGNGVISVNSSAQYETPVNAVLTLTVTDQCGNSQSDLLNIAVPPVPIALTAFPEDTIICIGEQVQLQALASGGVGDLSYHWIEADWGYQVLNTSPGTSSTYSIQVNDQCGNSASTNVSIGVEEVIPSFSAEFVGEWGIQLTNSSYNGVQYIWYFDNGDEIIEDENPYHVFDDMEPWQVTLVAIGPLGCERSVTEIYYPLADIYVPNCFTADGDKINESFRAYGHDLKSFEMWIFNRWGDLVFHSTDIDQAWDGSWQGHEHYVPDGMYNVVIKAEGVRGNFIERKASVLLVR